MSTIYGVSRPIIVYVGQLKIDENNTYQHFTLDYKLYKCKGLELRFPRLFLYTEKYQFCVFIAASK